VQERRFGKVHLARDVPHPALVAGCGEHADGRCVKASTTCGVVMGKFVDVVGVATASSDNELQNHATSSAADRVASPQE